MDNIQSYSDFLGEDKPAGAPDFHHSDAPDANGRFRDLSPKDLAAWLIKTRKKDLKKISGSLTQQVVFNRNEDPEYAEKMEKTRKEVYKQLGRKDLLDQMDESLVLERSVSGEEVWDHVVGITPEEYDIPWGFEDQIKDREFQMTKIDLKKLLKTDPDFKAHYKGGDKRYQDDEVSEYDLDFELVVVDGELLDGYSRASTLLRKGITKAYGFVAEGVEIMEENLEEGKIRVDLKRIMTKIMGSLEFRTNPKVRQELLSAIKDDIEQILDKHGYEMFEADKKPGPDAYMTGLDDETEEEKEDAMKKQAEMDDDDPNAYKDLPGDKEAREKGKVKTSKHVKKYHELYGESVVTESKYEDMLEDGYGHLHFIVKDLDAAEELADKIEAKDLADCDYYEHEGEAYLRIALSVGYGGKEVANIKKIERIVKQKAQAGSPEIWAEDSIREMKKPADKTLKAKLLKKHGTKAVKKTTGLLDKSKREALKKKKADLERKKRKAERIAKKVGVKENAILESNTLEDAIEKEMKDNETRFKTSFPTRELREIKNTKDKSKLSNSAAKVYKKLIKKYRLDESLVTEEKAKGDRGPIDDSAIEKGLKKKAEETGVPIGLIRIIMRRGMAAWKSGHRPGATQQQWGYARVNSFLTKQEGTWGGADKDVAKEVRDGGHDKGLKKG